MRRTCNVKKKAILCVDDEPLILLALIQELRSAFGSEFIYEQALNAEMALEVINELEAEGVRLVMVLTDWLMPGMKGDDFLDRVARDHPAIKTVMITGQADDVAMERAESIENVQAVLRKPWDPDELIAIIRAAVSEMEPAHKIERPQPT